MLIPGRVGRPVHRMNDRTRTPSEEGKNGPGHRQRTDSGDSEGLWRTARPRPVAYLGLQRMQREQNPGRHRTAACQAWCGPRHRAEWRAVSLSAQFTQRQWMILAVIGPARVSPSSAVRSGRCPLEIAVGGRVAALRVERDTVGQQGLSRCRFWPRLGWHPPGSGRDASRIPPCRERLGSEEPVRAGGGEVAADVEGVVGRGVHRQEPLRRGGRFEPLQLALAPPDWNV